MKIDVFSMKIDVFSMKIDVLIVLKEKRFSCFFHSERDVFYQYNSFFDCVHVFHSETYMFKTCFMFSHSDRDICSSKQYVYDMENLF